jgi:hypothetical protein
LTVGIFEHEGADPLRFAPAPGSPAEGELRFRPEALLDASNALDTLLAADRLIAWAAAVRYRAAARIADTIGPEAPPRRRGQPERLGGQEAHLMAVTEIAAAAAMTEPAAGRLVDEAAELCGPQRAILEALQAGDIAQADAHAILDQARTVPAEEAPHFARTALLRTRTRTGRRRTPAELRSCLRTLRERLYPHTIHTRKRAAIQERGLWLSPEPDGMCTLAARLPAEAGLAIFNGLDNAARTAARAIGETRSLAQLRADALAQRLLDADARVSGNAENQPENATSGFRPEVVMTIPVGAAMGVEESSAELEGYGPIDGVTARYLASLAPVWHRLYIDDETGSPLGVGRTAYRPPAQLRRYLAYRDGTCRFPGCTLPARRCEPDHTVEWHQGGTTDPDNLALLSPRHHALKSTGSWTYAHLTTGDATTNTELSAVLEWRSPLGRTHLTEPAGRPEFDQVFTRIPPPADSGRSNGNGNRRFGG